jgi:hypothetical protein
MPDASPPDLVERLRAIQHVLAECPPFDHLGGGVPILGLSPEQVARGLEAMRRAEPCQRHHPWHAPDNQAATHAIVSAADCDACWSSMLSAFLAAAGEGK